MAPLFVLRFKQKLLQAIQRMECAFKAIFGGDALFAETASNFNRRKGKVID